MVRHAGTQSVDTGTPLKTCFLPSPQMNTYNLKKIFIEFVTVLLLFFYVLVFWLCDTWDPSFPMRDGTYTSCIGRWSLDH